MENDAQRYLFESSRFLDHVRRLRCWLLTDKSSSAQNISIQYCLMIFVFKEITLMQDTHS